MNLLPPCPRKVRQWILQLAGRCNQATKRRVRGLGNKKGPPPSFFIPSHFLVGKKGAGQFVTCVVLLWKRKRKPFKICQVFLGSPILAQRQFVTCEVFGELRGLFV